MPRGLIPQGFVQHSELVVWNEELARSYGDDCCSICHENFTTTVPDICRVLDCSHVFHAKCVDLWFIKATFCPLCKTDLKVPCKNTSSQRSLGRSSSVGSSSLRSGQILVGHSNSDPLLLQILQEAPHRNSPPLTPDRHVNSTPSLSVSFSERSLPVMGISQSARSLGILSASSSGPLPAVQEVSEEARAADDAQRSVGSDTPSPSHADVLSDPSSPFDAETRLTSRSEESPEAVLETPSAEDRLHSAAGVIAELSQPDLSSCPSGRKQEDGESSLPSLDAGADGCDEASSARKRQPEQLPAQQHGGRSVLEPAAGSSSAVVRQPQPKRILAPVSMGNGPALHALGGMRSSDSVPVPLPPPPIGGLRSADSIPLTTLLALSAQERSAMMSDQLSHSVGATGSSTSPLLQSSVSISRARLPATESGLPAGRHPEAREGGVPYEQLYRSSSMLQTQAPPRRNPGSVTAPPMAQMPAPGPQLGRLRLAQAPGGYIVVQSAAAQHGPRTYQPLRPIRPVIAPGGRIG
eukprot:TRINITY_DN111484_c0_g1_i1.p1 TRINITY_DN111484_c0_g1~~TRINITY_DN111484_c0_g1_i1.p1  ORF type:complete len:523 (+),score=84.95 TRINITY_DN111484_c0_g1_i1:70-1638(+)